jgi:hypothetical protein
VPTEQPFSSKRHVIPFGCIEYHLDDAINVAICGRESAYIHSKAPRDRGTHLVPIEDFALDLA